MQTPLSKYVNKRDNNFNLIRFMAASLVLFTHSYALALGSGDFEPLRATIGMTWGSIAVDIFFITSGFLITSSYLARNNLFAFAWARMLRIYPALIVAIGFCILLGASLTSLSLQDYFRHSQVYKFFLKSTIIFFRIQDKLPGVFLKAPYGDAVNGALWTLPYEVMMYALVSFVLLVVCRIKAKVKHISAPSVLIVLTVIALLADVLNHFHAFLPTTFVHLFAMFFTGATYYTWKEKIQLSSNWAVVAFIVLFVSVLHKELFFIFYLLLLPYLVFNIAYVPDGMIRKFNSLGDYSYGIYIYAFPIQQTIAELIPGVSVGIMFVLSFVITLGLAMLSWHIVEKRFLALKDTYTHLEHSIIRLKLLVRSS